MDLKYLNNHLEAKQAELQAIETRLAELSQQQQELRDRGVATVGAIQALQQMIADNSETGKDETETSNG